MEVDSPESGAYGQASSKAGTASRVQARAEKEAERAAAGGDAGAALTALVSQLAARLGKIEDDLRNVKGRGGITVNWPEIAFTGSSKITKATATCNADSTITIEIESSP